MHVFYGCRERHYLKEKGRNKVENPYYSLGFLQQTRMVSSADHYDLTVNEYGISGD